MPCGKRNTRPVRDTDTCKLDAFSLLFFFFLSFFFSFFLFFFFFFFFFGNAKLTKYLTCVFVCVCANELMLKLLFHFKKNSFVQKFKSIFVREFHIERTWMCPTLGCQDTQNVLHNYNHALN